VLIRSRLLPLVGVLCVVAGVASLLVWSSTRASGAQTSHCARLSLDSRTHQRLLTGTGTGRKVVVIGDSYSTGIGLHSDQLAWTSQVPGRVRVFGFGGSGFSRTASGCRSVAYDQRAPAALRTKPDLVVIEGGLNDFDQPVSRIKAGYRRLLAEVGNRPAVVIGPAHAPDRAARAVRVDTLLRAEAKRSGTPYVSMIKYRFSYLHDGIHLTANGHRKYGAIVAAALG
jgi:acyl-CoA thioesterase-1